MSDRLNQCCDRLKEEIKIAEACLADMGQHLASASEERVEGLDARLKHAADQCNARRDQARNAALGIRQFLEQTGSEVLSKYEDWKTDREIEKIEKQADKLEDQAANAVVLAAFALLEAEVTIVKALKARKMAIEVAG
jgi:hypothetical protein